MKLQPKVHGLMYPIPHEGLSDKVYYQAVKNNTYLIITVNAIKNRVCDHIYGRSLK